MQHLVRPKLAQVSGELFESAAFWHSDSLFVFICLPCIHLPTTFHSLEATKMQSTATYEFLPFLKSTKMPVSTGLRIEICVWDVRWLALQIHPNAHALLPFSILYTCHRPLHWCCGSVLNEYLLKCHYKKWGVMLSLAGVYWRVNVSSHTWNTSLTQWIFYSPAAQRLRQGTRPRSS